jgi:phosphatidylserine decarboxylase
MTKIPLRKESIVYIIFLGIITLITYFLIHILAIIPFILLLFIIYFFRDPNRTIEIDDKVLLSPADGTIMDIKNVADDNFEGGVAQKVTIFLSVFNVHVNRSPIAGTVIARGYRPGKYLPAFKSHASELNERNTICVENKNTKVIVHQITGLVARRIVCWSKKGDSLKQGERFGLIKFGSCTELIFPTNVSIKVKKGDSVRGGRTIIGVVK